MSCRSVSKKAYCFCTSERSTRSLRRNTACNFSTTKNAVKLNRLLLKFALLCQGYSGKLSQRKCEIQFLRDNLGEEKVLESAFFRLAKSLKSKILATSMPPPQYTGFITNLPFWTTRRLGRMLEIHKTLFTDPTEVANEWNVKCKNHYQFWSYPSSFICWPIPISKKILLTNCTSNQFLVI